MKLKHFDRHLVAGCSTGHNSGHQVTSSINETWHAKGCPCLEDILCQFEIWVKLSLMHIYILSSTCRSSLSEMIIQNEVVWNVICNKTLQLMRYLCILLWHDCLWSNVLQSRCVAIWILHCKHTAEYMLASSVGDNFFTSLRFRMNSFELNFMKTYDF